ncbi:choice-of-anchor M domain-containing protein [Streptomyces sp. NRRL WC-3549]|uniref:choice-of-anchor M domain-containing protein n=1 Tax=Streptomyces sp. NRRL WC-3549 TaxID=1463925 RepID=UPI0009E9DAD7|nr:choice-of-anchor M domain-containing protein [Streptomyces sp. NRRL WC-3549]
MAVPRKTRWAAVGVVGSVALAGLAPAAFAEAPGGTAQHPPAPSSRVLFSLEDDGLTLELDRGGAGDGGIPSAAADPESGPEARSVVPDDDVYAGLGRPCEDLWILPGESTGPAASGHTTAPRWDTTRVPVDRLAGDGLRWALTGVEGPGDVRVVAPGGAGAALAGDAGRKPAVLFDSTDGLPDTQVLPAAAEGDLVWAFSAPGEYRIASRATAELTGGRQAQADTVWTVRVADGTGPEPSASAAPPTGPDGEEADAEPAAQSRAAAAGRTAADTKTAADPVADEKTVIDDGHVDAIAGKMVDGRLRTLLRDSRDPGDVVWREPSSVVLHVDADAREQVPAGDTYSFLGRPGSDFWLIPQVQKRGVVWAGWNTEALGGFDLKGPLEMRLTKVDGPGTLAVWETAGLGGAQVLYNSEDGLPDSQTVSLGVHAHANWGFSEQGTYHVTFRLSGTLPDGGATTDTRTYTFAVGDVDPNAVTPGGGSDDGGSTGGTGDGAGSTGGRSPGGGSTGADGPAGGSETGAGGSETGAGDKGSLAHTGAGPALPLGLGAGALLLGGGAAVAAAGRANRRRTGVAEGPAARS